ncbi:MAG: DUF4097 family beta strand repeat protein [Bdellovibrionaceae bacterium]|nr:DUF4097 family beta strand repeat protein [Pseudobdellovibrionaceae bacterium]
MKTTNLFTRFFIATVFTTIISLSVAAFSASKAYHSDPHLLAKLEEKYNMKINSGHLALDYKHREHTERTEDQWTLNVPQKKLVLKPFSGDIAIKSTRDTKIKIIATGRIDKAQNDKLLTITETPDELTVTELKGAIQDLEVHIEVPTTFNQEIEFDSTSGDVSIEDLNVAQAELKTISGEITLNRFTTPRLSIETVSGDTKVRNSTITKQISGESVSGEIEIENNESSEANLKSISGDIKLKMPKNNLFNFNLQSSSGDIHNKYTVDTKANKQNVNKAKLNIQVSTTSGDIEIE